MERSSDNFPIPITMMMMMKKLNDDATPAE